MAAFTLCSNLYLIWLFIDNVQVKELLYNNVDNSQIEGYCEY